MATSLIYYDTADEQIKGATVYSGGSAATSVIHREGEMWIRQNSHIEPDGTKTKSTHTLAVLDGGDTQEWTQVNVKNVWRRITREEARAFKRGQ